MQNLDEQMGQSPTGINSGRLTGSIPASSLSQSPAADKIGEVEKLLCLLRNNNSMASLARERVYQLRNRLFGAAPEFNATEEAGVPTGELQQLEEQIRSLEATITSIHSILDDLERL